MMQLWKIKTDLTAFEFELRRFARGYPRSSNTAGLRGVQVMAALQLTTPDGEKIGVPDIGDHDKAKMIRDARNVFSQFSAVVPTQLASLSDDDLARVDLQPIDIEGQIMPPGEGKSFGIFAIPSAEWQETDFVPSICAVWVSRIGPKETLRLFLGYHDGPELHDFSSQFANDFIVHCLWWTGWEMTPINRAAAEFFSTLQPTPETAQPGPGKVSKWDLETLGGMADLQEEASKGNLEARMVLDSDEGQEAVKAWLDALQPVIQTLSQYFRRTIMADPLNKSIYSQYKLLAESNDPKHRAIARLMGESTIRNLREKLNAELQKASLLPTEPAQPSTQGSVAGSVATTLPMPSREAHLDVWFDYFYARKKIDKRYSLKLMAKDCGRKHRTLITYHSTYKAGHPELTK
jgi:hypothetical protein